MSILPPDIQRYCIVMEEVKSRIQAIENHYSSALITNGIDTRSELVAIQFRKILEMIAFGSLIANREEYSRAYSNYISHWNAKEMLGNLRTINPAYFPVPLKPPRTREDGTKHFDRITKGFITEEQFLSLYNDCGSLLHTKNPYALKKTKVFSTEATKKWIKLINGLLNTHLARLIDSEEGWVVIMHYPSDGRVHAFQFQGVDSAP